MESIRKNGSTTKKQSKETETSVSNLLKALSLGGFLTSLFVPYFLLDKIELVTPVGKQ